MTIDSQIDRLNGLANDDPPLPFPHTSQIDGPLRELRCQSPSSAGGASRTEWRRSLASLLAPPGEMRREPVDGLAVLLS